MWKRLLHTSHCSLISVLIKLTPVKNGVFTVKPLSTLHFPCFHGVLSKVSAQDPAFGPLQAFSISSYRCFRSTLFLKEADKGEGTPKQAEDKPAKVKRKKLKGKRAVVSWLKHFRYKKKKELQRMTTEEKILFRLNKARNKEARLIEALKKLEPKEWSETTHDPEILTPEEHFYFLKMGIKCKNYVPIGR